MLGRWGGCWFFLFFLIYIYIFLIFGGAVIQFYKGGMHLWDVLRLMGGLSEMMCCSRLGRIGLAPALKITAATVTQAEFPGGEDTAREAAGCTKRHLEEGNLTGGPRGAACFRKRFTPLCSGAAKRIFLPHSPSGTCGWGRCCVMQNKDGLASGSGPGTPASPAFYICRGSPGSLFRAAIQEHKIISPAGIFILSFYYRESIPQLVLAASGFPRWGVVA